MGSEGRIVNLRKDTSRLGFISVVPKTKRGDSVEGEPVVSKSATAVSDKETGPARRGAAATTTRRRRSGDDDRAAARRAAGGAWPSSKARHARGFIARKS